MKRTALLILALISAGCASGPVGNKNVPEPVKEVNTEKYLGKWYEIGRYENRFEKGCEGVTAEYSMGPDGLLQVVNTCREGSADGKITDKAEGKAKRVEGSNNAKLKVSFFGPFFFGDYWVLDHADDYSWSIVGEPSGRYLWVLTREQNPSAPEKKKLWERAASLGYDTGMIKETKQ